MTRILVFIAAATGLILLACNPEEQPLTTSVKGTVIDKVTGAPVPGAYAQFKVYNPSSDNPYNYIPESVAAGSNGQFYYKNDLGIQFDRAGRQGYLVKGNGLPGISRGDVNYVTVALIPRDGAFYLNIVNSLNMGRAVYVNMYSPSQHSEFDITNGLVYRDTIMIGAMASTSTLITTIPAEETIGIYWDFQPLPFNFRLAPYGDSLFVARNDTATFTISF
ncbi:MAG: hypothetical protein SFV22_05210 [Saprospiraceae bacterium]|nr:hypothetical protein [Saprospiraceae bacterium]